MKWPSVKQWPSNASTEGQKAAFFHSSHANSSSVSSLLALLVRLSGLPPPRRHPQRLLPLLLVVGMGNFDGFLPPSQPQVGGILGWHWHTWQSFGTNEWTVAVLRDGYKMPFHHLPLVSLEPLELSSCSLGSVRALALWDEVSKMLQKGALEPVDQPGPGFYSWLFLVEKVTGAWRPVIDLSTLSDFVTLTKLKMETVASVLESYQEEGLDVLDIPQRRVLPDSCPSRITALSSVLS